jgi:hypothetical protein
MFGTELDTAYFNPNVQKSPSEMMPPIVQQEHKQEEQHVQLKYDPIMAPIVPPSPIFQHNDVMIKELQYELEKQKIMNKKENEPLIERYISKKKDVMKLLNISLSVLFAISMHFVFSDLIKDFITNNNFTSNKETFIKCMYPTSVLLLLWSFKVFNK